MNSPDSKSLFMICHARLLVTPDKNKLRMTAT